MGHSKEVGEGESGSQVCGGDRGTRRKAQDETEDPVQAIWRLLFILMHSGHVIRNAVLAQSQAEEALGTDTTWPWNSW